jgi:hypothetical protein
MPVPSSINDLSTTAGSNYPAGTETPTEGDNYIRALSSFIAQLRDLTNGTSGSPVVLTLTVTNATALNGDVTIGNAAGDALTINPAAITLNNSPAITGAASWASAQTFANLALTSGAVLPGTYTPTLTNGVEVSSSSASALQYVRVGDFVVVAGQVGVTTTGNIANLFSLGISLPIASNFTSVGQLGGSGADASTQTTVRSVEFIADTANDRASMRGRVTVGATPFTYSFIFAYRVI